MVPGSVLDASLKLEGGMRHTALIAVAEFVAAADRPHPVRVAIDGVRFAEPPHLLCLSIFWSSSSSDRSEMLSNPRKLSEAVVSIRMSST